jgi:hypothetical protein
MGSFARVQAAPDGSGEIADDPAVRLVILHPRFRHTRGDEASPGMIFANSAMQVRVTSPRVNRNMIVFLAPDTRRADELEQSVREYLAWRSIAGTEERIKELDLSAQQAAQARRSLKDSNETVSLRIAATYQWLLVPVQPQADRPVTLDELRTDSARERMAERASEKLRQNDRLRTVHGARNIRLDLDQHLSSVWQHDHVRVGDLWEYYCRYPYLPRLRDRSVLDDGILGVFGTGYDEDTGRYVGLALPHQDMPPQITDTTLLVAPERAQDQRQRELAEREAARSSTDADGNTEPAGAGVVPGDGRASAGTNAGNTGTDADPGSPPGSASAPKNVRFFGVATVNPERYARDFNRLAQEIIQHLAVSEGVALEIRVEIEAHKPDGYSDDKARIVSENARTLKFETYGFEDD